ncbi:MAG: alanine racemase [Alphaproteobacteria bacterium]|nr:alanine racemase [Alphaproteobacteria bacterium]
MSNAPAHPQGLAGRLTVDLGAIVKNWRALGRVSPGALTAAVVKADAYGTGLAPTATALAEAGAQFFFVATPDEGLRLRQVLPDVHVFVLNGLYPGATDFYLAHKLMPVLSSVPMLEEWMDVCVAHNEAFPAALHFDTGMNRLGFRLSDTALVRDRLSEFGYLPQMVMSHLACADQPSHEKSRTQLALFQTVLAQFPGIPASLANSAGLMSNRDFHFQMVRPGIAVYGGRAIGGRPNPMAHAITLEVPVLQVRSARTGETVGYGATHSVDKESRIATIALGYADGFFRHLGASSTKTGGRIAFGGRVLPVMGRISMDLVTVDVTELGDALPRPGDFMEVLGPHISVDEQADAAGTIGYEVLTSLKQGRYERVYLDPAEHGHAEG